jgi:hypothetical protein
MTIGQRVNDRAVAGLRRAAVALAVSVLMRPAFAASDGIMLDGFDVDLTNAYFVGGGSDANPGTRAAPFASINKGLFAAQQDPVRKTVVVAAGVYDESPALRSGVSVYGDYTPGSFVRAFGNYTTISGVVSNGPHKIAVRAEDITASSVFDRFVVFGPADSQQGGNSYAIYVSNSSANLQITNNIIIAGHGGAGADGGAGSDGADGADGGGRNVDLGIADAVYDAFTTVGSGECNTSNNRQLPNAGQRTCGATVVNGGNGGGNQCAVKSTCTAGSGTGCTAFLWNEFSALDGAGGQSGGANGGGAGSGAFGGDDFVLYNATSFATVFCYVPTDTDGDGNNTAGLDGGDGGRGTNGSAGVGCSNTAGLLVGGDWVGGSGANGAAGGNGAGGGGGGAGAGARCSPTSPSNCTGGHDNLGGHGGGGGSGGCGGNGGGAGGGGGGAFGIFIVGGSAPIVTGNHLFGGVGGHGGRGGYGGGGGASGIGGLGGSAGVPVVFCSDIGGRGGDGGPGAYGGGGGGGCGGASVGIYTSGVGAPDYCDVAATNVFETGTPGAGGAGGLSQGNSANAGQDGFAAACSFN